MSCHHCSIEEKEERREKIINIVLFTFGALCLLIGFILEKIDPTTVERGWENFSNPDFYRSYSFISFLLYTIGYLPLLGKTLLSCIEEIKEKEFFNEFLLMIVATIGAYLICEYPEALFVLLFSIIGELLEDYATSKSKQSIKKLINNMPLIAHVIQGEEIVDKDPSQVKIGDIIEIKPGEKVPLDGIIIKGSSSFDLSSLNGESLPKDFKEGDTLFSGSINLTSLIQMEVKKEYENSTLSKIMNLVEEEQSKKAKSEKMITRFASIYTPSVMVLSFLVFFIGFAVSSFDFANGGKEWLYRALSILLISCPCSLVIAVPIAFFAGIGTASKQGILIKGSISLENLAKSETFFFDKTGTLTEGKFVLAQEVDNQKHQIAASLESKSTHPLARAINDSYHGELLPVDEFEDHAGKGISGTIDGKKYFIGSKGLIEENGGAVPINTSSAKALYLLDDTSKEVTVFYVRDKVKDNASDAILNLKKEGAKETGIISGDEKDIAEEVRAEVGIDMCYSNLLPEEKLQIIKEKKDDKKPLTYVGDGINDSPSLLAADVGVSMGALGSDAAIEASDIVLLDDNIEKVAEAKRLSKKTMRVVKQGIFLSIFLKAVMMAFVLSGILGPYSMLVASISDTGVMVLCILNALRMMKYHPQYLR